MHIKKKTVACELCSSPGHSHKVPVMQANYDDNDNSLSMNNHITQMFQTCFYRIHNICRNFKIFVKGVPSDRYILVHAFVTSRLVYYNSLLHGLPKYQICKLQ